MLTNWNAEDEAWLRTIFGQPSGRKLIEEMRNLIPKVTAKKLEEVQIEALLKQGAENMFDGFIQLAISPPIDLQEINSIDLANEPD